MSYADEIFKANVLDILNNGTTTENQEVRPHWPDGTPAYTIKQFGVVNRYNLQKEFPAITVRKNGLKSCMDEILWIYQKKSSNINDLNSSIWDEWADEQGSIGKAYGYQIGEAFKFKQISEDKVDEETEKCKDYPSFKLFHTADDKIWIMLDQMDSVLYQLKYTPFSRRIMTSLWNVNELNEMNLQPCCWNLEFNVTDKNREDKKLTLNMVLNQRSNDMLAANNWNVAQYAILLMMIAQVSNMIPGELVHVICDQHIYDRHVDIIKSIIERETYPAPKVWLNPDIKNFYDFTTKDLNVVDYIAGEKVTFEVAI